MITKNWWVIGPHSETPMFFEGKKCEDSKLWFFKGPKWICEEGKTCFETQKEAQERVIKKIKEEIASAQSTLADVERKLLDIEAMNNGEMRSVEVILCDGQDEEEAVSKLCAAGLKLTKQPDGGFIEGTTNDMSKLYAAVNPGISWICLK
jgi:hypothetical protein